MEDSTWTGWTPKQKKSYKGRSEGLLSKGNELAKVHPSIACLVLVMKGNETLAFASEDSWIGPLRRLVSGSFMGSLVDTEKN
jgi:hypothetical protein